MELWQFTVIAVLLGALLVYVSVLARKLARTNAALRRIEDTLLSRAASHLKTPPVAAIRATAEITQSLDEPAPVEAIPTVEKANATLLTLQDLKAIARGGQLRSANAAAVDLQTSGTFRALGESPISAANLPENKDLTDVNSVSPEVTTLDSEWVGPQLSESVVVESVVIEGPPLAAELNETTDPANVSARFEVEDNPIEAVGPVVEVEADAPSSVSLDPSCEPPIFGFEAVPPAASVGSVDHVANVDQVPTATVERVEQVEPYSYVAASKVAQTLNDVNHLNDISTLTSQDARAVSDKAEVPLPSSDVDTDAKLAALAAATPLPTPIASDRPEAPSKPVNVSRTAASWRPEATSKPPRASSGLSQAASGLWKLVSKAPEATVESRKPGGLPPLVVERSKPVAAMPDVPAEAPTVASRPSDAASEQAKAVRELLSAARPPRPRPSAPPVEAARETPAVISELPASHQAAIPKVPVAPRVAAPQAPAPASQGVASSERPRAASTAVVTADERAAVVSAASPVEESTGPGEEALAGALGDATATASEQPAAVAGRASSANATTAAVTSAAEKKKRDAAWLLMMNSQRRRRARH